MIIYADVKIAIGSSCVCSSIAELLAVLMAEETQENELVEEEEVTQIPGAIWSLEILWWGPVDRSV